MNRTTVLVAAWIGAAIVSMLIASAAVGAVRDNVSETPQPLTAALPPTTATAPGSESEPSTTGTTDPSATTLATTTTAPETAPTSTQAAPESGAIKTFTVTGGSVSIKVYSDHLTLLGAVPAAGFTVEEKNLSSTQIEIEFRSGERESKFAAAIEDGQLKVQTEPHEAEDD
jgi:hypothetical protein